ncbi:MAG: PrsW family intramembrane metalloprotease [Dehalococcoidia bacterium]|nr:PrsW family intramembrane metalloprotease [Dehalococcoidia bacterium]
MPTLAIIPLAFAPSLFLLWYIYRKDIYRPEPRRLVVRVFILGMAATVPAGLLELLALLPADLHEMGSLSTRTMASFLVVGPVEEGIKFLVVWRGGVRKHIDEPIDGIVYASAAALGFASVENLFYMVEFGWWIILLRGPVSTLAHVTFASFWGYPLGKRAVGRAGRWAIAAGLGVAMALHGAFDFLLFTESWPALFALPLLLLGALWLRRAIQKAQAASPFRGPASGG